VLCFCWDWKHSATREIIQKADPDLSLTVIVQMKLDTKIPQFGTMNDILSFLRSEIVECISTRIFGGPFFTPVPSGRVHPTDDEITDDDNSCHSAFHSDDDFVHACVENEYSDKAVLRQRFRMRAGANKMTVTKILMPLKGQKSSAMFRSKPSTCISRTTSIWMLSSQCCQKNPAATRRTCHFN